MMNELALTKINRFLAERVEVLEHENNCLRSAIGDGDKGWIPIKFKLSKSEAVMFDILTQRQVVSISSFYDALYFDRPNPPHSKTVEVLINKLRNKLKPHGILIGTSWGRGYYLDTNTREDMTMLRKKFHRKIQTSVAGTNVLAFPGKIILRKDE